MKVNIHYENEFINLGLIRMFGSCDAAKMLQLLEKYLADFGIIYIQASIVSIVSDGASVMKKLGKLSQVYNQLCYAHGTHLAVCDVLYKFGNVAHAPLDDDEGEQEDHAPIDDDEGEQEDEELFDDGLTTAIPARDECPAFTPEIEDVFKKVRKVVKVFQKSTVKNEVLQKYVMQEHEKELPLILDRKTRLSSMFQMIERFIFLKKCIFKALLDLSIAHDITQAEFLFLDEMKAALEPVKLAVEAMCHQNTTLLTAEGIFLFLIREMKKQRTTLAKKLLSAVKNRIQQRRKNDLINLMRYLQNPNTFSPK